MARCRGNNVSLCEPHAYTHKHSYTHSVFLIVFFIWYCQSKKKKSIVWCVFFGHSLEIVYFMRGCFYVFICSIVSINASRSVYNLSSQDAYCTQIACYFFSSFFATTICMHVFINSIIWLFLELNLSQK